MDSLLTVCWTDVRPKRNNDMPHKTQTQANNTCWVDYIRLSWCCYVRQLIKSSASWSERDSVYLKPCTIHRIIWIQSCTQRLNTWSSMGIERYVTISICRNKTVPVYFIRPKTYSDIQSDIVAKHCTQTLARAFSGASGGWLRLGATATPAQNLKNMEVVMRIARRVLGILYLYMYLYNIRASVMLYPTRRASTILTRACNLVADDKVSLRCRVSALHYDVNTVTSVYCHHQAHRSMLDTVQ